MIENGISFTQLLGTGDDDGFEKRGGVPADQMLVPGVPLLPFFEPGKHLPQSSGYVMAEMTLRSPFAARDHQLDDLADQVPDEGTVYV